MLASPVHIGATWNESEALALSAALSAIDAWGGDLGALLDIDSDPSDMAVSQRKKIKVKAASTAPYRPRGDPRKQQLAALRAEVRDLQHLAALSRALVGGASSKVRPLRAVELQGEWEQLASTQRRRRLTAELENAKLRRLLQSQFTAAQHLLALSRGVENLKKALVVPQLPSFVNYLGPAIDPVSQLRGLDALLPRAEMVFATQRFTSWRGQCFHTTEYRNTIPAEEGVEMVCQGMWLFPGDVQCIANATWLRTMRPSSNHKTSMDVYEDENAMVSRFMGVSCLVDSAGAVQGQVAARILSRDLGDGSILIVTKMEAESFVGSEARGCAVSEGWIRIEAVPSRAGPVSLVKRYLRTSLRPPAEAKLTKSERRKWTQAVIAGPLLSRYEKDFEVMVQVIESMLVTPSGFLHTDS